MEGVGYLLYLLICGAIFVAVYKHGVYLAKKVDYIDKHNKWLDKDLNSDRKNYMRHIMLYAVMCLILIILSIGGLIMFGQYFDGWAFS